MKQLARGVTVPTTTLLERCGFFKLCFVRRKALRILCYHGVCSDEEAANETTPSYFVPASLFGRQMQLLANYGPFVRLSDEAERMHSGIDRTESAFAITFDDVAACTSKHALPILDRFGIRASFFVSTACASESRLFDFDVLRLLRMYPKCAGQSAALRALAANPSSYKRTAMDRIRADLERAETALRDTLSPDVVDMLRPMNWNEIRSIASKGHEIGGHTADHAVLGAYDRDTCNRQIEACVRDIQRELGLIPSGFAYPVGGPKDFDEADREAVRHAGFQYAVTTRPSFCSAGDSPFALPRVGIASGHTPANFAREISGILDNRRCQTLGWSASNDISLQTPDHSAHTKVREPASMREEEYEILRELLEQDKPRRTLEVGLASGRSTELFCCHLRDVGGALHTAIDPYQFNPKAWDGRGVKRVEEAGATDYLRVIAEPDYVALPQLYAAGESFDFVLIDGWHSFDFTLLDIFYADLLLNSGGTLVVHDSNWPAVYKACRFLETHKPYERIGPPIFVQRKALSIRIARRLGQLVGLTATLKEARDRRQRWHALAVYRKLDSKYVPNDFFAPF